MIPHPTDAHDIDVWSVCARWYMPARFLGDSTPYLPPSLWWNEYTAAQRFHRELFRHADTHRHAR